MMDGQKYRSLTPLSPVWANGTKGQIEAVKQIFQKMVSADGWCTEGPLGSVSLIVKTAAQVTLCKEWAKWKWLRYQVCAWRQDGKGLQSKFAHDPHVLAD